MVQGKKDEDSINILIGFILIVFVALGLLWALSGVTRCPEGTFSCDVSISHCGCCIEDAHGNPIESCDYSICPPGTYFFEGYGCCSSPNPASCLKEYSHCKNLQACGEGYCCGSDICEIQSDGSHECIPCSVGSVCNPENVNSCCFGYACNEYGFCESITSCVGMKCSNYNQPCQVCGSDSTNCIGCEDHTMCLKVPGKEEGICKAMCDDNHPVCLHCPSGCCNLDGTCASCLGNPCTSLGDKCSINNKIGCQEVCVMFEGSLSCLPTGNCPPGTYFCNLGSDCRCCVIDTGNCYTDNGVTNGFDDDDVCVGDDCIVSPIDEDEKECPEGYVYVEEEKACLKSNSCVILTCDDKSLGDSCSIEVGNYMGVCDYVCKSTGGDALACFPSHTPETPDDSDVPNWLLDLQLACVEFCEDCKNPVCNPNMNVYDLNGDTYLNSKDLEIFYEYYDTIKDSVPVKVTPENQRFDFNNDGYIDEKDEECILGVCGDESCKIIGIQDVYMCLTAKQFDNLLTLNQKSALGSDYKLLFNNLADAPHNFDCSGFFLPHEKTFCNYLAEKTSEIILVRNLSYVGMDRGKNYFYYSSCNHYDNNKFGMFIEAKECSNEINIYHSNEFLYRTMGQNMALFNYCMKNIPAPGQYNSGNCNTLSEDVFEECVYAHMHIALEDCEKCEECKDFTSTCYDHSNCVDFFGSPEAYAAAYFACALGAPECTSDVYNAVYQCSNYFLCLECQTHLQTSDICERCNKCFDLRNTVRHNCFNMYTPSDGEKLYDEYKFDMYRCVQEYPHISSANCMVYMECVDRAIPGCWRVAFNSYSKKVDNKNTKQYFCTFETIRYQNRISASMIKLSEDVMYQTGSFDEPVKGNFMGFIEKCPDGYLCMIAPEKCTTTVGGGLVVPDGFYNIGGPGFTFDDLTNDPSNYGASVGSGPGFGSITDAMNDYINQENIWGGGPGTVINPGGGTTGGGFGP